MQLSKNFTLAEMLKSQTGIRLGVDNTPPEDVRQNLQRLVDNILQPVRNHFGKSVIVTSGYRSPKLNQIIGGAKNSDHMTGNAADIEIPGVSNHELAEWISSNLDHTQVILEFYTPGVPDSGWVHVSYDPADLKKQQLTAVRQDGKTVYLQGLVA